jgi:hypothetical protein
MSQISLACGLPFCSNNQPNQTDAAVGLRITAIVLGTLAAIAGVLLMPQLRVLGPSIGWGSALMSLGTLLIFIGIAIKCVKKQTCGAAHPTVSNWTLSNEEQAALRFISTKPCYRGGAYVGEEIISAYKCMRIGQPQDFKPVSDHAGMGHHLRAHNNAKDLLKEAVDEGSVLLLIINIYKEKEDTKHVGLTLEKLVKRTRSLLKKEA